MSDIEKMEQRLQTCYDELKWLYCELYHNDMQAFEYFIEMLRRSYRERRPSLRVLDEKRLAEPGWYYSNKLHWNSVKPDGDIPDDLLKTWLDRSYLLVLQDLPKAKQREILGLSVCGTDCSACPLHGNLCTGCNEACGKVFHAPEGKPCPIYGCCVNKHHYATCASCSRVPCAVWQATRDPSMTDEQFEQSVNDRVSALRMI